MGVIVSTIDIVDAVLAATEDYRNSNENFKAGWFAPNVPAKKKSGKIPRFGRENQKLQNFEVAPSADSPRVDYSIGTTDYDCKVHRGSTVLEKETEEFDDTDMLDAVELGLQVEEALAIEKEYKVATVLNAYTNFTLNGTPTTKFGTPGAEPGLFMDTAKLAVRTKINRVPRHLGVSPDVGLALQRYVAQMGYGGGKTSMATLADVAAFFDLDEVEMALCQYDSAKPGKTSVAADMYEAGRMWLFYKPPTLGTKTPCFMVTPEYTGGLSKIRVEPLAAPHVEGIFIEHRYVYDTVTVDQTACYAGYSLL